MKQAFEHLTADSREMHESFKLSVKEIEAVLARKKPPTDMVKLAAATISSYAKIRSTESHDKALEVMLMRKDMKEIEAPKE